jgi:hypothetical protein
MQSFQNHSTAAAGYYEVPVDVLMEALSSSIAFDTTNLAPSN